MLLFFSFLSPLLMSSHYCYYHHCYHHCSEDNWLERQRRSTMERRHQDVLLELEKLRLKMYEKSLSDDDAAVKKAQKQAARELQREKELLEERIKLAREQARVEAAREVKRKQSAKQEQEADIRKQREEAEQLQQLAERERAEKLMQLRLKNRLEAFMRFPVMRGDVRLLDKGGLPAFVRRDECEEYLSYLVTMPEYARNYLTDLSGHAVVMLKKGSRMTMKGNNIMVLLPSETELREMDENDPDIAHFETPDACSTYLVANAMQMGVVRFADATGKEYWVTYRELTSFSHLVEETKR